MVCWAGRRTPLGSGCVSAAPRCTRNRRGCSKSVRRKGSRRWTVEPASTGAAASPAGGGGFVGPWGSSGGAAGRRLAITSRPAIAVEGLRLRERGEKFDPQKFAGEMGAAFDRIEDAAPENEITRELHAAAAALREALGCNT